MEGTRDADLSIKVDFLLLGSSGKNYLVELKSDTGSRRNKQDDYLNRSKSIGMPALVAGVVSINKRSKYKKKYAHLINKMNGLSLMDHSLEYCGKSNSIEIIYVQPKQTLAGDRCIDFQWISKWLERNELMGEFETEFSRALQFWSKD